MLGMTLASVSKPPEIERVHLMGFQKTGDQTWTLFREGEPEEHAPLPGLRSGLVIKASQWRANGFADEIL